MEIAKLTIKELKGMCTEEGIQFHAKTKRAELIKLLNIAEAVEDVIAPIEVESIAEVIERATAPEPELVPEPELAMKEGRFIDTIIMHCSDSDIPSHDDISVIRKWHTERGFTGADGKNGTEDDVGYHFFVKSNGEVQKGRTLQTIGAHAKGYNATSIGICIHGRTKFSAKSLDAAKSLVRKLLIEIPTITKIIGHNEVSKKTCPNYGMKQFKELIK